MNGEQEQVFAPFFNSQQYGYDSGNSFFIFLSNIKVMLHS